MESTDSSRISEKIRALVVDDEPLARSNVTVLLQGDSDVDVIGECGSGEEAVAEIRRRKPDLVFLDVQMPECDGFDVLERLGAELTSEIVFVTAYDRYALQAFEAGALDYLLKPFDDDRFRQTLRRVKERILDRRNSATPTARFAIKSGRTLAFVRVTDIDWIEADDYYARLYVGPRQHLLRRTIGELEKELDSTLFCRIHRSTIVNLKRVKSLVLSQNGEPEVLLDNGVRLRLSRPYRRELRSRLASA